MTFHLQLWYWSYAGILTMWFISRSMRNLNKKDWRCRKMQRRLYINWMNPTMSCMTISIRRFGKRLTNLDAKESKSGIHPSSRPSTDHFLVGPFRIDGSTPTKPWQMKSVDVLWLLLMSALEESSWLKVMVKSKKRQVNIFWEKIKERSKVNFSYLTRGKFWPFKSENDFFCETLIQHGDQLTHILQKQLIDQLGDDYEPCERDSTPLFKENMETITVPEYFSNLPNNSWLLISMTHSLWVIAVTLMC